MSVEVSVLKLATVELAVLAAPFARAVELTVLEQPVVVTAIAVIQAARTLQQAVDNLTAVAATIRQHGIGGQ